MRYGIDGRYIQDRFPGIGRYTYNLIRHMAPLLGADTLVIFHDPGAPSLRYDVAQLAEGNRVVLAPCRCAPLSLREQLVMPRVAAQARLDLYHTPHYALPCLLPCPGLATIHDLIPALHPEALPNPRLRWPFLAMLRLTLWRASGIVTDSESSRQDLLAFARPRGDLSVVPLAADPSFSPRPEGEIEGACARYRVPGPYVLYVGINKPHKNLCRLLDAWALLPADVRAGHALVLAGPEDPRYPAVRLRAHQLGLGEQVHFLGEVANDWLPALYSGAEAFVFPSIYEGFGLPVVEAMACGVPVACSRASSLPELAGDAAVLFDADDVNAIRDALVTVLSDRVRRAQLRVAGLRRARQYSWQRTAEQTLALYHRLARRR